MAYVAGKGEWWLAGKKGSLSPCAQAQVWALVRMSEKLGFDMSDPEIAAEVEKVGGGHLTKQATKGKKAFKCAC